MKIVESDEIKEVVIATNDPEKALYIVAKDAVLFDKIEIHFREKYAPTIEYTLRILRKAFGWLEKDRGTKEVSNTKCKYNHNGFCKYSWEGNNKFDHQLRCSEGTRNNCKKYTQKYQTTITVNFVYIEKAGGIRDL